MPTNISDNANAPGTTPEYDASIRSIQRLVAQPDSIITNGVDPKAPHAADPLNAGMPTDSAVDKPEDILDLELGGTGTIIVGGILVDGDYNPELTGRERIRKYDEMRKGDATIRLGLAAVKYPIFSTNWYIKPGEGEDDKGEKTTFINQELFHNPNFSWTQFMNQAFLFCDYGNSFFEKVFRMRADGKVGWKKFAPRLPKTIWRYTMDDGITPGITQTLPTGGHIEIPQWKLMSFILDLEGANYEGVSLLRSAYKHWFYKDLYYRIDSIASERQGMGVPVIRVPAAATPADKLKAKSIAKNMRVNQQAYLDLPPGFTVEYIDTKAKELKAVWEGVMHHDRQMLKSFLAHFLDLGASKSGSMALSDNQMDMFIVSEQYLAKIFQESMNMAVKELIDLNFSGTKPEEYPILEYGTIGKVDVAKLSTALMNLSQAGILLPDDDLERHVRQVFDLPASMALADGADEHIDWETRRMPKPPLALQPGQKPQPQKKIAANERMRAFEFAENLLTMKEEIEKAISQKENAY